MKLIKVGFPLNEKSAEEETYATLNINGYEAQFGMTGISVILNTLKLGYNPNTISCYIIKDAIDAFEALHEHMWELCEAQKQNQVNNIVNCILDVQIKKYDDMTPEEKEKYRQRARQFIDEKLIYFEKSRKATAITPQDRLRHYTI